MQTPPHLDIMSDTTPPDPGPAYVDDTVVTAHNLLTARIEITDFHGRQHMFLATEQDWYLFRSKVEREMGWAR